MNPTRFHLEPDITPLDSRIKELEINLKLNCKVNMDIYVANTRCNPWLRLSERTTELVTKQICLDSDGFIVAMGNCNLYIYKGYRGQS